LTEGVASAIELSPSYELHTMFRWNELKVRLSQVSWIWAILITCLALVTLAVAVPSRRMESMLAVSGLATMAYMYGLFVAQSGTNMAWPGTATAFLAAAAPLVAAIVAVAATGWRRSVPSLSEAMFVLALAAAPYTYAFGTNSSMTQSATSATVFVVVALAFCLRKGLDPAAARRGIVMVGGAGLAVTTLVVLAAMERPYRLLAPLRLQESVVALGASQGRVSVDAETARYVQDLRHAIGAGDRDAPPVIDMTGEYPGAIFAIGGKPIGLPWLIGGYTGSGALAARALRKFDCRTLASSWVLLERNGQRSLPVAVLESFGRQLTSAIEVRGPRENELHLLMPPESDRDAASARCEASRKNVPSTATQGRRDTD
jgi:hypothetical protein